MKFVSLSNALMFALLIVGAAILSFGYARLGITFCTAGTVLTAVNFYRLRCRNKLIYGLFEMATAMAFFYFLALGLYEKPYEPMRVELIVGRALTFFAAIYFMVRALDNIGQGLRGDRATRWKLFFEGKSTRGSS
ncbi:hypothetical protein LQG66_11885 [Bradyrhizobium ontarionense]|uniref:Uncharacterized protein n=1 Tax=Bradyrhizobium ontarionense TaxID=2898149 RepID=A0ABY3RJD5_9BRAD|nr:hypothetical protein [Bradyrhizobium sp. A19]UFZ06953.1 hypothetical protein LQG66_11885 [Bradyrhizobium sp. A19]